MKSKLNSVFLELKKKKGLEVLSSELRKVTQPFSVRLFTSATSWLHDSYLESAVFSTKHSLRTRWSGLQIFPSTITCGRRQHDDVRSFVSFDATLAEASSSSSMICVSTCVFMRTDVQYHFRVTCDGKW
jgi:hypothetical protein